MRNHDRGGRWDEDIIEEADLAQIGAMGAYKCHFYTIRKRRGNEGEFEGGEEEEEESQERGAEGGRPKVAFRGRAGTGMTVS